jgi:hypothetical protein
MTIGELVIPEGVTEFATDALYQQVHFDATDVAFFHDFRKVWFIRWFEEFGEYLF